MNVGDRVTVQIGQSFVEGTILGIPVNRGNRVYKVESADLLISPQWFSAYSVHRLDLAALSVDCRNPGSLPARGLAG